MYKKQEQGGVGCAFRVLAGDVGKTLLACLLCRYVCGAELGTLATAYAGLGCILGHDYPFWHWFHGGKGVACDAAALILIWPMGGLFSCLIGLTAVLLTGYLPLGAVLIPAAFILPAFLEYLSLIHISPLSFPIFWRFLLESSWQERKTS